MERMNENTAMLILAIFIPFMGYSFASEANKNPEFQATVEIVDGVECIHNTETPLNPDKTVIFVEELSIGGEYQGEDIILFEPYRIAVDENENIYICEFNDQVIKIFNPDGKFIKTIGAQGRGPGEFQRIGALAFTKDGKLFVFDEMGRRTTLFDSDGNYLTSHKWNHGCVFISIKSSSYVFSERQNSGTQQFGYFDVKESDFEGNEVRSYGEFSSGENLIIRVGKSTFYSSLPVTPSSIFAGDSNKDWLYHCVNDKYVIEVYDASGKLFRKIDRPYEPVLFTKKDAEQYRERFGNDAPYEVKKAVKDMKMPKVKNVVARMRVDDESRLWIRTNETKEQGDSVLTAYDIFNSDGLYHARAWISFTPYVFKKGKVYSLVIDEETGYRNLKRYKVVWN